MRKYVWAAAALLVMLALILAACGGGNPGTGTSDPAAAAVEALLLATVNKDAAKVSNMVCKDYEADALLNMDALQAVKAELNGVSCKNSGTEGSATLVSCTGKIDLTYDNEKQSLDVSRQIYKVIQQSGDYLVCGVK